MNSDRALPKTFGQKLWIAVRFVVFGIVGFWVMLAFTMEFASCLFEHYKHTFSLFVSLPLALLGALMVLYGVGEWGRWAYLWVFLSIPISVCLGCFVPGEKHDKEFPVILAAVAAVFTYAGVKIYYDARDHHARDVRTETAQDGSNS